MASRTGAMASESSVRGAERGCVAGRQQQRVALAERHVEVFGEMQHQLAARLGPSRLDEAQVPCRDVGLDGELQLAESASLAPVP